ncbi:MAG: IS607 family transposase [archaeon]|nr:IS607 family transposase [archaeon]
MKAGEVMQLLRISRSTLHKYATEDGLIGRTKIGKRYDYFDEDVFKLLNKNIPRKIYIYARVSTAKQKKDLENQIEMLKMWAFQNGLQINGIYSDVASGINFDDRKDFFKLLDEIMTYKVGKVIIAYKDRLSRVGFFFFDKLLRQFGTEIITISEVGNKKLDAEEVFEEIISLLHCYSMKLYSNRRNKRLEVELRNESNEN